MVTMMLLLNTNHRLSACSGAGGDSSDKKSTLNQAERDALRPSTKATNFSSGPIQAAQFGNLVSAGSEQASIFDDLF